jgi:AAA domain
MPDPPGAEELLGPLVRRGQRIVLGAHTGEGKTVMARQIVRAIVEGEDFLGWQGIGGVRALIVDAEQEAWSIRGQLRDLRLDQSDSVDYLSVPDGLALDQDGEQAAALNETLGTGAYALVAADPTYKLHRGDSNAEREVVDLMRIFDAWRARYGFALLMPTHCRKPPMNQSTLSIHDLFGSSAYVRGAEVVLGLQLVGDGYSRLHFFKSRDPGLPVRTRWGLLYDRQSGFRRDPKDGQPSTAERLGELRASDPSITQAAAAEALGVAERTVRRHWKQDEQKTLLEEDEA